MNKKYLLGLFLFSFVFLGFVMTKSVSAAPMAVWCDGAGCYQDAEGCVNLSECDLTFVEKTVGSSSVIQPITLTLSNIQGSVANFEVKSSDGKILPRENIQWKKGNLPGQYIFTLNNLSDIEQTLTIRPLNTAGSDLLGSRSQKQLIGAKIPARQAPVSVIASREAAREVSLLSSDLLEGSLIGSDLVSFVGRIARINPSLLSPALLNARQGDILNAGLIAEFSKLASANRIENIVGLQSPSLISRVQGFITRQAPAQKQVLKADALNQLVGVLASKNASVQNKDSEVVGIFSDIVAVVAKDAKYKNKDIDALFQKLEKEYGIKRQDFSSTQTPSDPNIVARGYLYCVTHGGSVKGCIRFINNPQYNF